MAPYNFVLANVYRIVTTLCKKSNKCIKIDRYVCRVLKVSGPFVETPCILLCMQNINYAEISA